MAFPPKPKAPGPARPRAALACWAAALLIGLLIPTRPAQGEYIQFATSGSYLSASEQLRTGYVAGLVDALIAFDLLPEPLLDCVSVMRLRDIRASFDRWLHQHPAESRFSLPTNLLVVLDGLCE